jgi:hypothetical protein
MATITFDLVERTIIRLRQCLGGTVWQANPDAAGGQDPATRVFGAAEFSAFLEGESKALSPSLYVTRGTTTIDDQSGLESTLTQARLNEQLNIAAVLTAKPDKRGADPTQRMTAVRADLWQCLLGWNPSIQAACDELELGYCTGSMNFLGDSFFDLDRERYVHQFQFNVLMEINSDEQGANQDPDGVPLNCIFGDMEPVGITMEQVTVKQDAKVGLTGAP